MSLPSLRLKANAERRLRAGHLWVYSNEVDATATPLSTLAAGDQAILETAGGKPLGIVGVSPNNLICARLLSRDLKHSLGKSLLVHRIQVALSLRERLFEQPCYRLVHGEADLLPGLVVDRFGDHLLVQLTSATMERNKDAVLAALVQVLKPRGVLWKNDSAARDAEGLARYVETAFGVVPEWLDLEENGVKFQAPVQQKTVWHYEQRMNRARLAPYVKGKRVLDLFSHVGGWGVQAAVFGANEVFCTEGSAQALDGVERNAALNGVAEKITCIEGDIFEAMKELKNAEERFDVVIATPPAFIKRKKDQKNGEAGYRRLNEQAMRLLGKDGILVSTSSSLHLPEDELQNILLQSARHLDRNILLLERGGQGPDHPVHPAIPETRAIKSLTCRILPNS